MPIVAQAPIFENPQNIGFYLVLTNPLSSCQTIVPSCHLSVCWHNAGSGTMWHNTDLGTMGGTIRIGSFRGITLRVYQQETRHGQWFPAFLSLEALVNRNTRPCRQKTRLFCPAAGQDPVFEVQSVLPLDIQSLNVEMESRVYWLKTPAYSFDGLRYGRTLGWFESNSGSDKFESQNFTRFYDCLCISLSIRINVPSNPYLC